MRYHVKVKTNAKHAAVVEKDGIVEVSVVSQPIDGKANEELVLLLANHFDVSKSSIEILKGSSSKEKIVFIAPWQRK